MIEIKGDTVVVDKETTRLEGFRMENTAKAPVVILFLDEDEPKMIPLDNKGPVPIRVRSINSEAEIQVISFEEIKMALAKR